MIIGSIGAVRQVKITRNSLCYLNGETTDLKRISEPMTFTLHNDSTYALDKIRLEIQSKAHEVDAHAFEIIGVVRPEQFGYQGGFGLLMLVFYQELESVNNSTQQKETIV